ncbi:MAG: tRNA (adenosine(37)-N6)-threonylcarbamoyltransferase complex ATPase subunit type 1 TsaE [Bryobacterales bacterium]|nr:tRNA (adenosine(37)-N6)-threonylcarbamoyltransferase complex ATPase subunit type 1 TsaE [Bryobacterales bacterium]
MPVVRTHSEAETIAFGRELAGTLPSRCAVLLIGNLGAGKTTLAKGIAEGLGAAPAEEVSSPTFTLIHQYSEKLFHIDLYRLDTIGEVRTLGLDEIFDREAVVLVEWGERFPELMPELSIEVHLRCSGEGEDREIEVIYPGSDSRV